MKHHRLDLIFVVLTLLQFGFLVLPFTVELTFVQLSALVLLNGILITTNLQCVAHNFTHNPFFKDPALNRGFSLINSLGIGFPQSFYRVHHLQRDPQEESIFLYSVRGVRRTNLVKLYRDARNRSILINLEIIFFLAFIVLLAELNWKLTLGYVLSSYILGHHFAEYVDRKRTAESSYSTFYNLIWFNSGFRQEHVLAPQIHWALVSESAERDNKKRPQRVALRIV